MVIIVVDVVGDDEPRSRQASRLARISRSIASHNSLLKIFTKSGEARLDPTKSKSQVQSDRTSICSVTTSTNVLELADAAA